MTVNELLHRMSAMELAEWEAFFRLEAAEAGMSSGGVTYTNPDDIVRVFRGLGGHHS